MICTTLYEVHKNTPKAWTVMKCAKTRKAAIAFAEKLAKQESDPNVDFGVYDTKKKHYIGFAHKPY